jgi:UDP-2-acetamido-3-amino-2,3-dideoxy-glucuronate N-acetyltransferase
MSLIHPLADISECEIGIGTRIWQFAVVFKGARIGAECNICSHTLIEGKVVIGDRVTIKSGVQIWDGSVIGDDVFIGPNATFSNDLYPRSKQYDFQIKGVTICNGASVGANATLLPGITIGEKAIIGAGAVVTKSVPALAVVVGNPAKIVRYIEDDPIS